MDSATIIKFEYHPHPNPTQTPPNPTQSTQPHPNHSYPPQGPPLVPSSSLGPAQREKLLFFLALLEGEVVDERHAPHKNVQKMAKEVLGSQACQAVQVGGRAPRGAAACRSCLLSIVDIHTLGTRTVRRWSDDVEYA